MTRCLTILLFLLLGAAATLMVVACICLATRTGVHFKGENAGMLGTDKRLDDLWRQARTEAWPDYPSHWNLVTSFGLQAECYERMTLMGVSGVDLDQVTDDEWRNMFRGTGHFVICAAEVGWPRRCARLVQWQESSSIDIRGDGPVQHDGVVVLGNVFPKNIELTAFATNTLFYGSLLSFLICAPFALRRQLRKRRGGCLKCGYPAGASPSCTECGTAMPNERHT